MKKAPIKITTIRILQVSFLAGIGGWNARGCANNIIKESIKDEALLETTFFGWNEKKSFQGYSFFKSVQRLV